MSYLNNSFDLISQMVNETFSVLDEDPSFVKSVSDAVLEHKSLLAQKEDEPYQLEFLYNFYLGAFDQDRKCFVFQIEEEVLEFPENWGPFKLSTVEEGRVEDLFSLAKYEDLDYFFDIIELITSKSIKSLKCVNCGTHLKLVYELEEQTQLAEVLQFSSNSFSKAA